MIPERTPSEHRAAVAAWALQAPANDSDIFGRAARWATSSKHAALSDELAGLQAWRAFRAPANTWLAPYPVPVASNDNYEDVPDEEKAPRPNLDATGKPRPSPEFMMAALDGVEFTMKGGRLVPTGGDIERCPMTGRIARLGRLKFSNGAQTHKAQRLTIDGRVVTCQMRMPVGALMGYLASERDPTDPENDPLWFEPVEKTERAKGSEPDLEARAASNAHFRWYCGADQPGAGRMPRPAGDLRHQFLGGQNRSRPADRTAEVEDFLIKTAAERHIIDALTPLEVEILDTALESRGFADIGRLVGCTNAKAAERAGQRVLIETVKKFDKIRNAMP